MLCKSQYCRRSAAVYMLYNYIYSADVHTNRKIKGHPKKEIVCPIDGFRECQITARKAIAVVSTDVTVASLPDLSFSLSQIGPKSTRSSSILCIHH